MCTPECIPQEGFGQQHEVHHVSRGRQGDREYQESLGISLNCIGMGLVGECEYHPVFCAICPNIHIPEKIKVQPQLGQRFTPQLNNPSFQRPTCYYI